MARAVTREGRSQRGAHRSILVAAVVAALFVPLLVIAFPDVSEAATCPASSTAIACENAQPGTPPSVWDLDGDTDASIVGFSDQISVTAGSTVGFKIRTDASAYTIGIYRLGYYQGNGARHMATISPSVSLPQSQPACLTQAATGLVDCGNWSRSAAWAVPANAVSGVYLAHLVRTDNGEDSHIAFVVRNDASHADLVFQTSDTTWQAYNTWGGNSFYVGAPAGRAYKLSYNRPIATRESTPGGRDWLMANEYPMIRWLEQNGYDVTYQSGVDTDRSGSLLTNHRAFLSVGHDEYWSGQQRANVEAARDAGVNLAFFSGNEVYWKTRWEPSIDGSSSDHRTIVTYKETWANAPIDPVEPGSTATWRDPRFSPPGDGGRPENELTGTSFRVQSFFGAIQVPAADGKMRIWRNTSVASQSPGQVATLANGTLGYEFDETPDNGHQPAGLVRLSTTTTTAAEALLDWGSTVAPATVTHHLTLYRASSGSLVFSAGTIQWSWGLDANHDGDSAPPADGRVQQATLNILADMGAQPSTRASGLVAATSSTDATAPTATITAPAEGLAVTGNQVLTVSGTASDSGGGVVGAVEVSVDGGQTWITASGRSTWTYSWMPTGTGPQTILARASDDSGNVQPVPTVRGVVVSCPCSLLGNTNPALPAQSNDTSAVTLGMRFHSDVAGKVTAVRFYKGPGNTGTHIGSLWTDAGVRLAQVTFSSESASGWQVASFATPVAIQANQTYVVSYSAPVGRYAVTRAQFLRAGIDRSPLHAPMDGDGQNGIFRYGSNVFPDQSYESESYSVDVLFASNGGTPIDTTPPSASAVSPSPGATGVSVGTSAVAQFSEPVVPASIQMGVTGPSGPLPGTIAYDAPTRRATFTPSASLVPGTVHVVTVSAATDPAGNALVAPLTWSFTTAGTPPPSTCPCTLFAPTDTPAVASESDPSALTLGVRFRADTTGLVTGVRFYKGPSNTGTHTGSLWRDDGQRLATVTFTNESASGWQQASFATPVPVEAGRTYVVSYFAPNGGYAATAGGFAGHAVDRGPLHAPADGDGGGNGLYLYGADALPTTTWSSTNYWVDVVFTSSVTPPDTVAPVASAVSPAAGATGVGVATNVVASFDEPVQPASIVMSVTGPGGPVGAATSYDASTHRATLDPAADLTVGTTYQVRVSASDLAGNPMTSPYAWSFTTIAALPVITPGWVGINEGNSGITDLVIGMTLSAPSTDTVTAQWNTVFVPGATWPQGDPGVDYTPVSGTFTFAPGQVTTSIVVPIHGDVVPEPTESVVVSVHDSVHAAIGGFWGLALGGIVDDDTPPAQAAVLPAPVAVLSDQLERRGGTRTRRLTKGTE